MSPRARVAKGVPTGGEFATEAKDESPDLVEIPEYGTQAYWDHARAYSDDITGYGLGEIIPTGGGCEAIQVKVEDGSYLLVTDGDASLPDGDGYLITSYDPEGYSDDQMWMSEENLTAERAAMKIQAATNEWKRLRGLAPRLPEVGEHVWTGSRWGLVTGSHLIEGFEDERTVVETTSGLLVVRPGEKATILEEQGEDR